MSIYLDASVVVALFVEDALSARAETYLRAVEDTIFISDFAAAEFASAVARRVRMGEVAGRDARTAFANFDIWTGRAARRIETVPSDMLAAGAMLRRLDLTLRTPDALHIAMAQRTAAVLATFDGKMAECAEALGCAVDQP